MEKLIFLSQYPWQELALRGEQTVLFNWTLRLAFAVTLMTEQKQFKLRGWHNGRNPNTNWRGDTTQKFEPQGITMELREDGLLTIWIELCFESCRVGGSVLGCRLSGWSGINQQGVHDEIATDRRSDVGVR
jgi:hypothetical protein